MINHLRDTLDHTRGKVPEICRFLGIVIKMFFEDHGPPHFHAIYGDREAVFAVDSLELIEGNLPPRVKGLVIEWASSNHQQLRENWELMAKHQKFKKMKPLV